MKSSKATTPAVAVAATDPAVAGLPVVADHVAAAAVVPAIAVRPQAGSSASGNGEYGCCLDAFLYLQIGSAEAVPAEAS